jgi:inner membrane protein
MDSLTQIVLGAAVGEVVLGKRAGNRAMVWGAVAGTLPDLDVFANAVTDPISALAYHRAFTHSLTYSVVVPVVMGLLVHRLYGGRGGGLPQHVPKALLVGAALLATILLVGSYLMPIPIENVGAVALTVTAATMAFPLVAYLRERWRRQPTTAENPSHWAWMHLFFWSIITHPLLDSCTTYGTQLLEPFSSLRVSWHFISVADPLYTTPFLVFLLLAAQQPRGSRRRAVYNWAGIAVSSAYMLVCVGLHHHATQRLQATLQAEQLTAHRSMVAPTILNSVLWQATAEGDSVFYSGQYSLFDETPFFKLKAVPKHHDLLEAHWDDTHVGVLRWFSDGYFSVVAQPDSTFIVNDLRFGLVASGSDGSDRSVFYFLLKDEGGQLRAQRTQQGPQDGPALMARMWERMRGI